MALPIGVSAAELARGLRAALRDAGASLESADQADQALIDPNYLADPEDLRLSIAGVRRAREVMSAAPLRPMIDRAVFPVPTGPRTPPTPGASPRPLSPAAPAAWGGAATRTPSSPPTSGFAGSRAWASSTPR